MYAIIIKNDIIKIVRFNIFDKVRVMLYYNLYDETNKPKYIKLYNCLKADIMNGVLTAEYKLPSKRAFANELSVSVITVENAYEQLVAEGYIFSRPRKGFYVSKIYNLKNVGIKKLKVESTRFERVKNEPNEKNKNISAGVIGKGEYIEKGDKEINVFADFTFSSMPMDSFPFSEWTKSNKSVLRDEGYKEILLKKSPSKGLVVLRNAISNYLYEFRGIDADPENIVIGAGTEYLYGLIISLIGDDLLYSMENPGYEKLEKIYLSRAVNFERLRIDDFGIRVEDLEDKKINVAHVSPSHHFPSGITMPISRRMELLSWAKKGRGKYIIEDDYDSDFRLAGVPVPTLYGMANSAGNVNNIIYLNTFAKSLSSTIRIAYMVLPDMLSRRYEKRLNFYSCTVSNFEQCILANFINEGYYEKHVNRMKTFYRKKRDRLIKIIRTSRLGNVSKITQENAGLHFILELETNIPDKRICKELLKKGVKLLPLSYYDTRSKHKFIINYSGVSEDVMATAIEKMESIIYN